MTATADVILQRMERVLPVYERSILGGPEMRAFLETFRSFVESKAEEKDVAAKAVPVIELDRADPWKERLAGRFMEIERLATIRYLFKAGAFLAAMQYQKALEAADMANAYNQELAG